MSIGLTTHSGRRPQVAFIFAFYFLFLKSFMSGLPGVGSHVVKEQKNGKLSLMDFQHPNLCLGEAAVNAS